MRQRSQRIRAIELLARWRMTVWRLVQTADDGLLLIADGRSRGDLPRAAAVLQCAELRIWQGAAMDAKNNNRKLVWSAVVMEPLNQ